MMIEKLNIRAAMMNSQTVVTTFHTLFIRGYLLTNSFLEITASFVMILTR